MIGVDAIGQPVWVDAPAPTQAELIENAETKKMQLRTAADSEIEWRQDAVDAGISTEQEVAELAEWKIPGSADAR